MAFDQAIADRICERLADGESLRTVCKDDGMPAMATVFRWLATDENAVFREQYGRARETQAHNIADEIIEIADTPVAGFKTKTNEKGEIETTEGDMIEHRRLRVDSRKWYLSKVLPKVYGDKLDLNHSGGIKVVRAREITSDEERAAAWTKP